MNLVEFLARRASVVAPIYRQSCPRCRKALSTCYCSVLRPFRSPVEFVILQHAEEARNPIATARMAHLSITNSHLFVGDGFAGCKSVDKLIADPMRRNYVLFPSATAQPLEAVIADTDAAGVGNEAKRRPVFWVLDAKWAQVPKMLRLSPNIRKLPMVKFSPNRRSTFQIRRQPHPDCLSTIESIYLVIERYLSFRGLNSSTEHQALLDVFHYFVRQQLDFVDVEGDVRHKVAKARRAERRRGGLTA